MQKSPPRFVPTLTQVVQAKPGSPAATTSVAASATTIEGDPQQALSHVDLAQQLRQQLLTRSRQYIDIELQKRIREAVSQLALEHAHKLFEELQPQLEATISQVIDEAIAQALAHAATHAP
jgi:hypothetical protein